MVIDLELVLVFLLANFIMIATGDRNSIRCQRSCGSDRVSYPFGFSDGCDIRLNCSRNSTGSEIELAGFRVNNLTSDSIMIRLPAKCDRKVDEIKRFYGANYAVSWQSALLLQNCSSPFSGCSIPTNVLASRFKLQACDSARKSGNVSCFTANEKGTGILNYDNITRTCGLLVSSFVMHSSKEDLDVSLQFQTLQLQWWLPGIWI